MGDADGIISEEDIDKTQEICYTYDKGIVGIGKRQGANGRERRGMLKKAKIHLVMDVIFENDTDIGRILEIAALPAVTLCRKGEKYRLKKGENLRRSPLPL